MNTFKLISDYFHIEYQFLSLKVIQCMFLCIKAYNPSKNLMKIHA